MTLTEAFQLFDRVTPPEKDWFTIEGEHVGVPVDCGVSVVLNTSDGMAKLSCSVCGLQLAEIAGQWVVVEWGKRGIRLLGSEHHPAPGGPS
jgi:hypothetical protein